MKIEEAIEYVSQLFMNLTGFIDIRWEHDGDAVVIFNKNDEGSPADDVWEAAILISKLTGWETYQITRDDTWNKNSGEPYYVGLEEL